MKLIPVALLAFYTPQVVAFAPARTSLRPANAITGRQNHSHLNSVVEEWVSIAEGHEDVSTSPVRKIILEEGDGATPKKGSKVEIDYVGTLGSSQESWGVNDVLECWLKNQQGLYDALSEPFLENNVDGSMLFNEEEFNEAYVTEKLGVSNKIQCKKTIMAAKRLRKQVDEFSEGSEFDSSISRGKTFEFVLGQGKVIKAMDLLVGTMKVGEKAKVILRSDYGYGSEGYSTAKGEVVVPPFATLCFEISLISVD